MFSAILLGVGWFTVVAVDWALDRWPEVSTRRWLAALPLALLLPFFPVFVPIAVAGLIAWAIDHYDGLGRVWNSRAVSLLGAVALTALGAYFVLITATRAADILA
jgi:hypothetical protein